MPIQIPHTVKAAFEYHLSITKLSKSSLSSYGIAQEALEKAGLWHCQLEDFNGAVMKKFLNGLDLMDSNKYFNFFLKIKGVIKKYVLDHDLKISVASIENAMKMPKQKEDIDGEEKYLTEKEFEQLKALDLSEDSDLRYGRDLFLVMCLTGMAVGDVVNFDPKKHYSKDNKWVIYNRVKNGQKCTIPLQAALIEVANQNEWPARIKKRMIQKHCEALGKLLGKPLRSHSGRHTFGCLMLTMGFSMESVSAMLGHTSIATTQKFYAKVLESKMEREMKNIKEFQV